MTKIDFRYYLMYPFGYVMLKGVPKFRLTQKLNSKLLQSELEAIEEVVNDSKVTLISPEKGTEMVRVKTTTKARRMFGISRDRIVNSEKIRRYTDPDITPSAPSDMKSESDESAALRVSEGKTQDRLSQFESFRGTPRYQDLTHPEIRRVQELFERRKMLARKMQWLKNNQLIDPVAKVTKDMKRTQKEEHRKAADEALLSGETLFPSRHFSSEMDPVMQNRIKKLELAMVRDTAISRARTDIRNEKLERSAVMNTPTPNIGPIVTDPLKRHLNRRRVRVALLIQQYLEELLTCNSSQIILDHLGGASISIDRVVAPSTRGVHDVYVRVTSSHEKTWVQDKLTVLAPKLRSQLAVRVNYGYTPELKFHVLHELDKFDKTRLMGLATEAKQSIDKQLHTHFLKEMNWK